MVDTAALFGDASAHLRSFSYLPLRDGETFGLLALASEDAAALLSRDGHALPEAAGRTGRRGIARHLSDV